MRQEYSDGSLRQDAEAAPQEDLPRPPGGRRREPFRGPTLSGIGAEDLGYGTRLHRSPRGGVRRMQESVKAPKAGEVASEVPSKHLPPAVYEDLPEPLPLRKVLGPGVVSIGIGVSSGRVDHLALHHLPGGAGLPVGGGGRRPDAVLHKHGDRTLHARDRGDRHHRLHALLEALGAGVLLLRDPPERLARRGDERGDDTDVRPRLRQPDGADHHRAHLPGLRSDHLAGRLPDAGEGRVRQGRPGARLLAGGGDRRRLAPGLGRPAGGHGPPGFGRVPDLPVSLILGAAAFAGAGGVHNLIQSNWIRDKGYGMGARIPRLVSP